MITKFKFTRVNMKKIFNLYKTAYTNLFKSLEVWFGVEFFKVIGAIVLIIALAVSSIAIPIVQIKSFWAAPVVILLQLILIPIYYALFNYADKNI